MLTKHILMLTTAASMAACMLTSSAQAGPRSYADIQVSGHQVQQNATTRSILVPYGKSTTIDLPGGMMDVIVSNPDIITARAHTASRVLLTGKAPGQTNVFFYGHDGQEMLNLEVRVERDIAGLSALIRKHAPESSVDVAAFNNNILLSGAVADAGTASRIVSLANLWLSETTNGAAKGEITNMMTVKGNQMVQLKVTDR